MRSFVISILVFIILPVLLLAQQSTWKGKIEIKNGVQYIHNPREGIWDKDSSKKLVAEKIFSLGRLDAPEEVLFSWVKDITTDTAGNIYACDSRENRVQVYDKNGHYLRTIGRKGKGPGELMRPLAVRVGQGGKIYILDSRNHRVSIFYPNGKFFRSFRYDGFAGESLDVDSEGNVYLHPIRLGRRALKVNISSIITKFNRNGKVVSEFGKPLLLFEKSALGYPYYAINEFAMQDDSTLIVGFFNIYQIHVYQKGVLKKVITRESPIFTRPEILETNFKGINGVINKVKAVKSRSSLWKMFVLPSGKLAVLIRDAGKDYRSPAKNIRDFSTVIDLFDKTGRFLKSFPWDWRKKGFIVHVDRHGYFYSNFGETEIVPGVTKWKVSCE